MRFDEVMELALYHPVGGFYEGGGRAGRGGADFITSPEVGGLFGAVMARALESWWEALGRPDPFLVVEAGAGRGRWPGDPRRRRSGGDAVRGRGAVGRIAGCGR